ncbi:hypothetical protein [Streptomyces sediminimaris]|uniref:hypothetical protein n=1 Tax=Streptomyces sediminimaris TaxID=3383721 RepID=UPI00399BBCE7
MRSSLQRTRGRGRRVVGEYSRTPEILVKFVVLAGLLYLVVRLLRWGTWIPFAGASLYLLWEIGRIDGALGELAGLRQEPGRQRQETGHDEPSSKRPQDAG